MPRKNPLERSEYNKSYYQKNRVQRCWQERERYKNGGKEQQAEYRVARLEQYAFYQRESRRKNAKAHIVMAAKARAKRDGLPFNISVADLEWPEFCPVLNIKLDYNETVPGQRRRRHANPSLDRCVNELGYVKGNAFVISHRANRLKSDATIEELKAVLAYMEQHS
jgi:hypothetical protein